MSKSKAEPSPLTQAAETLDEELRRFEHLAEGIQKAPFNSQKGLERAANALKEIADCDERISGHVKTLASLLAQARQKQVAQADGVAARARELEQRTLVFQSLMERYAGLGSVAAELNGRMQGFQARRKEKDAQGPDAELATLLDELLERTQGVVAEAEGLTQAAGDQSFTDVAQQADSLRQQLLGAKNKLSLLRKALAPV